MKTNATNAVASKQTSLNTNSIVGTVVQWTSHEECLYYSRENYRYIFIFHHQYSRNIYYIILTRKAIRDRNLRQARATPPPARGVIDHVPFDMPFRICAMCSIVTSISSRVWDIRLQHNVIVNKRTRIPTNTTNRNTSRRIGNKGISLWDNR